MKNLSATVAKNVKRILTEQSKTAETLAFEIGMSKSFLYDFLKGDYDISLKNLQKIVEGLEINIEVLFE